MLKDWPTSNLHPSRKLLQGSSITLPSFPSAGQSGPSAAGER